MPSTCAVGAKHLSRGGLGGVQHLAPFEAPPRRAGRVVAVVGDAVLARAQHDHVRAAAERDDHVRVELVAHLLEAEG
eukprot:scaffold34956_cov98-Phaeocystis_antarctica.AAC.1